MCRSYPALPGTTGQLGVSDKTTVYELDMLNNSVGYGTEVDGPRNMITEG